MEPCLPKSSLVLQRRLLTVIVSCSLAPVVVSVHASLITVRLTETVRSLARVLVTVCNSIPAHGCQWQWQQPWWPGNNKGRFFFQAAPNVLLHVPLNPHRLNKPAVTHHLWECVQNHNIFLLIFSYLLVYFQTINTMLCIVGKNVLLICILLYYFFSFFFMYLFIFFL